MCADQLLAEITQPPKQLGISCYWDSSKIRLEKRSKALPVGL